MFFSWVALFFVLISETKNLPIYYLLPSDIWLNLGYIIIIVTIIIKEITIFCWRFKRDEVLAKLE